MPILFTIPHNWPINKNKLHLNHLIYEYSVSTWKSLSLTIPIPAVCTPEMCEHPVDAAHVMESKT